MSIALIERITTALAQFSSATRLYEFTLSDAAAAGELGSGGFLVEAFAADDALHATGPRDVIALSTNAHIDVRTLLGLQGSLAISLADGSRTSFSGDITQAAMLGSEGGVARYRLRLTPWLWRLTQVRNSRVWQDKSVIEIVDDVFSQYQPLAQWRWSAETDAFLADVPPRSYCCQYRESDHDFVRRLLAEEGLSWRVEQLDQGHGVVLFADSSQETALPLDASCAQDGAIRFHAARVGEKADSIQALQAQRSVATTLATLVSYDYKAKKAVAASVPSRQQFGQLPQLESYDVPGQYAFAGGALADHYAELQMQGIEARSCQWQGRSTVRTLAAGTRIDVTQGPLAAFGDASSAYTVLRVTSVGVNNLPAPAMQGLAELFGPIPELLEEALHERELAAEDMALVIEQARGSGYANRFEAIAADVIWRPQLPGSDGRTHPKPTAHGAQSAIVIGADGSDEPSGADELYCDALGRVRIRYHWQDQGDASCWVRVAQRTAGGGMGSQFLPRIGQEVLVQFLEGDIDRPIIVGALYNGQGEGGHAPTPGGRPDESDDPAALFKPASDHAPSAQGNLAGGHSPLWHGASAGADGHRNGAAQWGVRTKEFGGSGYNQLLFDDTDAQGRVQLRSTYAATELTLGHLIHGADNYRGSLRGQGAELRTDAYGAVRGGAGLLVSSYAMAHSAKARDPAGDNGAGIALMKQAVLIGETFSKAAVMHRTVALAAAVGSIKAGGSVVSGKEAPLAAMLTAVSGMLGGASLDAARADAGERKTAPSDDALPHTTDPIIAISAKAGLGVTAGGAVQMSSGETVSLMSGADTQFVSGGQMRVHTGQAIGVLGGAMAAGDGGLGVQMIAAQGAVDVQAQADVLNVQARDEVSVISASSFADFAAAKRISLSTAGGANITIEGGNITVQCPGKILIHAGKKSMGAGARQEYALPVMPVSIVKPAEQRHLESTFAYDQLKGIADKFTKLEFVTLLVPIFGYDIPAGTYIKLYEGLRNGSIKAPKIKLMNGGHFPASFDNETREILVHQAAADRAAQGKDDSWLLVTALLHEFGHYIDAVLRHDLADKNSDGTSTLAADAPLDEGAKYAYAVAFYDFASTNETEYARYVSPKFSGPLKVQYHAIRQAIRAGQDEAAQRNEGKDGTQEFFGAGLGEHYKKRPESSFGHQSIEFALRDSSRIYTKSVLKQIYFGNWLRDFSQVLDPAIVRRPGAPKDFPRHISRAQLTNVVAVLAEAEFVEERSELKTYQVTEKLLGVYRPVEHIDNPRNLDVNAPDPRSIDADFQPKASAADLAVDPQTCMKKYIVSSRAYMAEQLSKAAAAGRTAEGYRHFGAALHVLEDYFAHSNFVELSLIKSGHKSVLPWTAEPTHGKHRHPIVTGMFDKDDVIASTAGLIANLLFKVEWEYSSLKPGERTLADRLMLILLREHSSTFYLDTYNQYLAARDWWATVPGHDTAGKAMHYSFGLIGLAYNFVYSSLLKLVGETVDDQQVVRVGNPNVDPKLDPTHSQLAKDHDTHAFHTLAVKLARHAVTDVGKVMAAKWLGTDPAADPAKVAMGYLAHPCDSNWQDPLVAQWAAANPAAIKRGESATEWEALEKAHRKQVMDGIENATKASKFTWNYVNKYFDELFK